MPPANEKVSVIDRIHREIRDDILEGKRPPGQPLVEMDLCVQYGASRNSIREVLHQLGREGLATFVRNKGVMVRTMQRKDLREIYVARRALEMQAVLGGTPLSAAVLERMQTVTESAEKAHAAGNWRKVGTLSLQFHQLLVSLIGSELLDDFFLTLCAQLRLVFSCEDREENIQTMDWIDKERKIAHLLRKGERQAAAAELEDYLSLSEKTLTQVVIRWTRKQQAELS
ncbi:GntR family transcriptional regulator [Comamonas sp. J-3]|uniref:GntR family transcriptional regulator n=1 Tax=Comamonas trifloxystrobinivorans TaxID=3350256 RepID=UPI00372C8C50